jgi:hypothetical protein
MDVSSGYRSALSSGSKGVGRGSSTGGGGTEPLGVLPGRFRPQCFLTRNRRTQVNLSQEGPIPRWGRPAHGRAGGGVGRSGETIVGGEEVGRAAAQAEGARSEPRGARWSPPERVPIDTPCTQCLRHSDPIRAQE